MKRWLSALSGIAVVSAFGLFAAAGPGQESGGKLTVVIGELIDSACFTASDGDAKGKDHAECAQKCMATGIPAGILPEGKGEGDALVMLTNPKPFAAHAAKTIKVEGVVNEKKHLIDVKKAYVKDGDNWKEIQLDDEHHKMGGGEEKKSDGHGNHKH